MEGEEKLVRRNIEIFEQDNRIGHNGKIRNSFQILLKEPCVKKSMNTLSITVDIEDWYHVPSVIGSPFSVYKDVEEFFEKWEGRYDYLSEPTKRVLGLLDEFD